MVTAESVEGSGKLWLLTSSSAHLPTRAVSACIGSSWCLPLGSIQSCQLAPGASRLAAAACVPCGDTRLALLPLIPPPSAGVLFDASQYAPPLSLTINLAEPGPRAAARLWTALLESLIFVTAAVSAAANPLMPLHCAWLLLHCGAGGIGPGMRR